MFPLHLQAARIDEALLPARPRPQTSMVLARRLLTGALGVKVTLPKEEREREARAIRQAKGETPFTFCSARSVRISLQPSKGQTK